MKLDTFTTLSLLIYFAKSDEEVNYKKGIADQITSSINYKYRTDASEFEVNQKTDPVELNKFDFVVVGGGTTGSVLTARLSENKSWKILLLEAGVPGNATTEMPALTPYAALSNYNWGFKSVPQKTACLDMFEKQCNYPRGQGLGGSSLINGAVMSRGNRHDYDKWELEGWNYDQVLPYFKKMENLTQNNPKTVIDWEYHGTGGELTVEEFTPIDAITESWLEANEEKGFRTVDYNGRMESGAATFQKTTKHGRRADLGTAYLKSIKGRPNLTILTRAYATRILIKDKKAFGVEFTYKGKTWTAGAKKEVILSAGAFNSPQLLMLSGVGPQKHLEEVGIDTIANLEVGSNLREHAMFFGLQFKTSFTFGDQTIENYIKQYSEGVGPLSFTSLIGGVGFYKSKPITIDYPDLELTVNSMDYLPRLFNQTFDPPKEKSWQNLKSGSFMIAVIALHTKSSGTVRLKSKNPFDYPLLDPHLLSDSKNDDIQTLYKGIKLALGLTKTKAFARFNVTLIKQDVAACRSMEYLSPDYWYCLLRQFTAVTHHPVGTCRMGPSPENGDVLDAQNRVYGVKGLRVADASIIPFPTSGHTNVPCAMIGEKVADMLKIKYIK